VLFVSETVTVPAGTFNNCIKVKMEENYKYFFLDEEIYKDTSYSYFWIHKDIGVVLEEIDGENTSKLISKNF
jgi:hypothetical protein